MTNINGKENQLFIQLFYIYYRKLKQQKMEPAAKDEPKRNEFGTPHPKPEDYDVYKYSRPTVRVAYNEITQPNDNVKVPQPSIDPNTKYQVIFKGNVGILKVPDNTPRLNIGTKKQKSPRGNREVKNVSCTVF